MRHLGLALALACAITTISWADNHAASEESEGETVYVPRSERDTQSVLTFKGSGKGLVIIDHKTGEVTRYTTKRQKALHALTPEAQENARVAWERRQEEAAEYDARIAEATAEAEAQAVAGNGADSEGSSESADSSEESEPETEE